MSFAGTFVNGKVVLDGSPRLPEGARVLVRLSPEDDVWPILRLQMYLNELRLVRSRNP